ncbi:MAG: right-handed parallel beta-helix repeat-containing protein [Phycisphaerae bacterium]|nr:right-handed parallel beta-helix repeat-containing protein [Phycisphaerae bacterium]
MNAGMILGVLAWVQFGAMAVTGENRAFLEAQKRPAFKITDPVGLVADEGEKAKQRRAGADLHAAIMQARADGAKQFRVSPGEYRFANMKSLRFEGLEDFTIDATGATFWFERDMKDVAANPPGLELVECKDITLKGVSIDFDPPLYMQAMIVRVDHGENAFEVDVDEGFPVVDELPGGQMTAYRAGGEFIPQAVLRHLGTTKIAARRLKVRFDPSMRRVVEGSHDKALAAAWQGKNLVRVGDYLAIIFRRGRSIHVDRCERITLEDATLYASPGMGILETGGQGGSTYRRVKLIRKPGTRRLHAGMADAFHSALTARGPTIEECEFSFNSDDMINLHGFFTLVCHRYCPRKLVVFPMRYNPYRVGGKIAFYDFSSVEPQGQATITAVEPLEDAALAEKAKRLPEEMRILAYKGDPYVITLDRDVAAAERSIADTFNYNAPGFVIRNCYFHDTMGRALLLNGASDGLVENNVYERMYGGIRVYMESWFYMEGGFPRNVRVVGNRLTDIGGPALGDADQPVQAAIYVGMVPRPNRMRKSKPLANIEIANNVIERPDRQPIIVTYTRGAKIRGNRIVRPHDRSGPLGLDVGSKYYGKSLRSAIYVAVSNDADVRDNTVVDPDGYCTDGPVDIGPMTENVTVE